ncbi:40S ribosomal protein S10 [Tripterygium wilfordii]|uniref:40S ribosomal protein S10 n=1 Tax=Tripterygium wilfordii TaxID=458696 RepID=A0A7J7CES9_TRIWF|nr:40S ribosomal protein S10 [Tripterygium wilfordii]
MKLFRRRTGEKSPKGVLYAKKDFNLPKHPEIDVPNLQVIKLMQSFKSKEYVCETFAWMHYYWYLTNDGIEFLRTYRNLPSEIVPATLKKPAKPVGRPMGGPPALRETAPGLATEMGIVEAQGEVILVVKRQERQLTTSLHSGVLEEGLDLVVAVVVMALLHQAQGFKGFCWQCEDHSFLIFGSLEY